MRGNNKERGGYQTLSLVHSASQTASHHICRLYSESSSVRAFSLLLFLLMESIRTWLVGEIGLKSEVNDSPLCCWLWSNTTAVGWCHNHHHRYPHHHHHHCCYLLLLHCHSHFNPHHQVSSVLLLLSYPNITLPPPPWIPC